MSLRSVNVVGGGIVGLAAAYRIQQEWPDAQVRVLEKEDAVARHQTGNNSGVLHSGLYYKPGSAKARLAIAGIRQMVEFCQENGIAHEICGKLVVASNEAEIPVLKDLLMRGTANGLEGLQWLSPDEAREIEPHVGGVAALRVPQEGIVDYVAVCRKLVAKIETAGGQVVTGAEVRKLRRTTESWLVETAKGTFAAQVLVNCAGLHCDRVSEMAGEKRAVRILPFRGEYYKIRPQRQSLVRNLIYPVPDPKFPFLGVHFTRLIHGGIEAGPNAVLAFAREGYRKTDIKFPDLFDALSYSGLWKFLGLHAGMCWNELRRSFSRNLFCRSLQHLVPDIRPEDLETGGAGVRAQAITPAGQLVQDFYFLEAKNALHVLNAPSPAATASLAIGTEIMTRLKSVQG